MKTHRKRRLVLILSSALLLIPLFYNACQGSLTSNGFASARYAIDSNSQACQKSVPSSFEKLSSADFRPPGFALKKLRLDETSETSRQKTIDPLVSRGSNLVAIINNVCVGTSSIPSPLFESILADQFLHSELPTQALHWILDRDYLESELESLLSEEPCIVGVSWQKKYSLTAFDDPNYNLQPHLRSIRAPESYDDFYNSLFGMPVTNGPTVIVAVLDTGVDSNHSDLKNNLWSSPMGYGIDATTIKSSSVSYNTSDISSVGHGTHVSGIIGAVSNNSTGIIGTMPYNVKIMPIRVFNISSGQLFTSSQFVYDGIQYAVQNGAHVINLSLASTGTGPGFDPTVEAAIDYALSQNVTVITVLGNSNSTTSARVIDGTSFHSIPAQFATKEGVLGVGSFDSQSGNKSSFSHYGTLYGEIAAPGAEVGLQGIYSTLPNTVSNSGYGRLAGTSQAGPQVAAAAALTIGFIRQITGSSPSPKVVEQIILGSAVKSPALASSFQSGNRLDLRSLAQKIKTAYQLPSDPTDGSVGPGPNGCP